MMHPGAQAPEGSAGLERGSSHGFLSSLFLGLVDSVWYSLVHFLTTFQRANADVVARGHEGKEMSEDLI